MKIATNSATEARNRFGDVIRIAYRGQEHLIVERAGIPVVAIVPFSDYEQLLTQFQDDAKEKGQTDISSAGVQNLTGNRLMAFLDDVHA